MERRCDRINTTLNEGQTPTQICRNVQQLVLFQLIYIRAGSIGSQILGLIRRGPYMGPRSFGKSQQHSYSARGACIAEPYDNDVGKEEKEEEWPTGDENIVRYLISKQKFDGLWNLDGGQIEKLTGKSLTPFPKVSNDQMLIAAIVVVVLETRFASLSSMWRGVVQKARKRLMDLLGKDMEKLGELLSDIRQEL